MPDGAIKLIAATGDKIMNCNNIDYTITINGLELGDPDPQPDHSTGCAGLLCLFKIFEIANRDGFVPQNFNVGEIKAEEGMGQSSRRNVILLAQAIICPTDQFDEVWDELFQDYLNSGGQAIIDERLAAYEKFYE